MEHKVQCMVCGEELATHTCQLCGKPVGKICFDEKTGICFNCERKQIS